MDHLMISWLETKHQTYTRAARAPFTGTVDTTIFRKWKHVHQQQHCCTLPSIILKGQQVKACYHSSLCELKKQNRALKTSEAAVQDGSEPEGTPNQKECRHCLTGTNTAKVMRSSIHLDQTLQCYEPNLSIDWDCNRAINRKGGGGALYSLWILN